MLDIIAAFDQEADDRDRIRDIEEDDTRRNHAVKSRIATQIQQPQHRHDDAANEMRSERDISAGVDMAEEFGKGQAAIASKGPAEAALPRVASDQAPDARGDEEGLEDDGARFALEGLVEEGEDGDEGGGGLEVGEGAHAEEEADGVEPGGDEADGHGAHDGDRDHFLGTVDFFRQVGGAVEAGEGVIGIDEADDEGDAVGRPACVVHEVGKDEFGVLMGGCLGGDYDEDHEEGYQRSE